MSPEGRREIWTRSLAAAAGGLAIAAAFLDFSLGGVAWVAFVPILVALDGARSVRGAAALGLVAGMATNVPAFGWLVNTIHAFGGFPIAIAGLFYGVLSLYSSLQFVIFALAFRRSGFGPLALAPAAVWVTLELVYPNLFPWRLANSQLETVTLLQVGDLTGPFGLSFVMVWVSAAVARAARRGFPEAKASLGAAAAAAVAVGGYGFVRLPAVDAAVAAAPAVRVGVVQGNLSIHQKNNLQYLQANLAAYRRLTRQISEDVDVVIWPETVIEEALPRDLERLSDGARQILALRRPLLTGALTFAGSSEEPRFYNSIVLFDADGRMLGLSDKQILMPFGEYMPFGSLFPFLYDLSPMTGDFAAGTRVVPLDVPGVGRFAPLNCYEDLKAPIARSATGEGGAEVLFAVANDAWFGKTAAPFQHEALALWRAVENRRYLIRVTNTGVTDVVDPAGRVLVRLPIFTERAAVESVRRLRIETFYTRWGDVFAWTVAVLALLAVTRGSES